MLERPGPEGHRVEMAARVGIPPLLGIRYLYMPTEDCRAVQDLPRLRVLRDSEDLVAITLYRLSVATVTLELLLLMEVAGAGLAGRPCPRDSRVTTPLVVLLALQQRWRHGMVRLVAPEALAVLAQVLMGHSRVGAVAGHSLPGRRELAELAAADRS
jgi:hypothetical protein